MQTDGEKWKEYIYNRFDDKALFCIDTNEKEFVISISLSNNSIKTNIAYIFDTDFKELTDIHFYSGITDSFSGEYSSGENLEFSDDNIKWIENNWTNIPLEKGWKENLSDF